MGAKETQRADIIYGSLETTNSELGTFWKEVTRELVKRSIPAVEDAAKQIISIITLVQTIYFAAISFSSLKSTLKFEDNLVFLFITPIVFWLITLAFAIFAFLPQGYPTELDSPKNAKKTFEKIVDFKLTSLYCSYLFLVIGFLILLIAIFYYLYWMKPIIARP
jgi:hypothetical protein